MENKITINGKTFKLDELSPELRHMLAELGVIREEKRSPFERAEFGGTYWSFTRGVNEPCELPEFEDRFDNRQFENANYFTDKEFASRLALKFELWRRLLRYAYNNKVCMPLEDINANAICNMAWTARYNPEEKKFTSWVVCEPGLCEVLFTSQAAANDAIEKVINPFVEEHPEILEDY